MIPVAEALARLFALVPPPQVETVALRAAHGRVLAAPVAARRDQPPFAASAMDGYAVAAADARPGAVLQVVGEAKAGERHTGSVGPGETVRIFTGAPVPPGLDRVVIQEDVTVSDQSIVLGDRLDDGPYVRPAGGDFAAGFTLLQGQHLRPADVALLAAMNVDRVPVSRTPRVAILCTGDELVLPGAEPGPDQIIASNGFGLAAMLEREGAEVRLLPIAADTLAALEQGFDFASGADLILTCGGASVGEHDLVAEAARAAGASFDFHKVAMRPGKPLMAGRLGDAILVGLPGNPVSALVCGTVFVTPLLSALKGLPAAPVPRRAARLARPLAPNGPREHYMRGIREGEDVAALPRQDSSLLSVLAQANLLIVRPPHDPARDAGETVDTINL